MAIPEVVRGDYLIVLLIHMLVASRSIIHVQIISQFCQKKRRILNTGLPTASGVYYSWLKNLSGLLGCPSFDLFLSSKGRLSEVGKEIGVHACGAHQRKEMARGPPSRDHTSGEQAGCSPSPFGPTLTPGYTLALCNTSSLARLCLKVIFTRSHWYQNVRRCVGDYTYVLVCMCVSGGGDVVLPLYLSWALHPIEIFSWEPCFN